MKGNSQEEKNKDIIVSYIDEIFNKHNLSSIERYFGGNSVRTANSGFHSCNVYDIFYDEGYSPKQISLKYLLQEVGWIARP